MRIKHLELSIGQIPGRIQGSGFCQVIFVLALSSCALDSVTPSGAALHSCKAGTDWF